MIDLGHRFTVEANLGRTAGAPLACAECGGRIPVGADDRRCASAIISARQSGGGRVFASAYQLFGHLGLTYSLAHLDNWIARGCVRDLTIYWAPSRFGVIQPVTPPDRCYEILDARKARSIAARLRRKSILLRRKNRGIDAVAWLLCQSMPKKAAARTLGLSSADVSRRVLRIDRRMRLGEMPP